MKLTTLTLTAALMASPALAERSIIFVYDEGFESQFFSLDISCREMYGLAVIAGLDVTPLTQDDSGTWVWTEQRGDITFHANCANASQVEQVEFNLGG